MLKMILMFAIYYSTALVVTAKSLEERVEVLEELVMDLEYKIVREYGLVKRCQLQQVDNGISVCRFEGIWVENRFFKKALILDLRPGVECKVVCNPGWIPSPGQSFTRCQIGGQWSSKLQCEEPLLIIAGGFGEQNGPKALNNIEVIIKYWSFASILHE